MAPTVKERLEKAGFVDEGKHYIKYVETDADPSYALITAWDGTAVDFTDAILVGFYDITDVKIATLRFASVAEFLSHLEPD